MDETIGEGILQDLPEGPISPLSRVRQISMSDESSLSPQPLVTPIRVYVNLHPKLLGEKGMEIEIVISLEILNSDSFPIQALKLMEYGKIVSKNRILLGWEKVLKTEEEFEEIAEDHQMADLRLLQI
jgi:hypothetical protein